MSRRYSRSAGVGSRRVVRSLLPGCARAHDRGPWGHEAGGTRMSEADVSAVAPAEREAAYAPAYGSAVLAALGAWLLYVLTLAPSTAFWDTSEYIATAHI